MGRSEKLGKLGLLGETNQKSGRRIGAWRGIERGSRSLLLWRAEQQLDGKHGRKKPLWWMWWCFDGRRERQMTVGRL